MDSNLLAATCADAARLDGDRVMEASITGAGGVLWTVTEGNRLYVSTDDSRNFQAIAAR